MKRLIVLTCLAAAAAAAQAMTPAQMLAQFEAQARQGDPSFNASPQRGRVFFAAPRAVNADQPACTTCHTDNAGAAGRHYKTGKAIQPLAPRANPARFSDLGKSEKWFGRNCREVVGRDCSAAEKADFVAFLLSVQ